MSDKVYDEPCKKCGCVQYTKQKKGPHLGLYCANCGLWLKWVKKQEQTQEPKQLSIWDIGYDINDDLPWE